MARVDHESLANLIEWQLANGTHGVSIGGSTGEPGAQSIEERIAAIRTVTETVNDRVPVVVGTGTAQLHETIELTAAAVDLGIDASLIITPYYARPTQEALYVWYRTVAAEFPDLPIIAYNVPSRTAVDIAPETVARLYRDVPNFVGIKETTKDFEHFSRVHPALRPRPDRVVGHRAAVPSAARARRRRVPQRDGEHRAGGARADVRAVGGGRSSRRPATSTTACTRSSTCCSSRPTRRPASGCSSSAG